MKIWIVVLRADSDAAADGVEDEMFVDVYKRLPSAQKACAEHLEQALKDHEMEDEPKRIDWAETTTNLDPGRKRFLGRPQAQVDFLFELHQAEVV